jgi:predicted hydrocarbon binding protein
LLNKFYDKFIFTNTLQYKKNNFFLVDLPFVICPSELLVGLLETGDEAFEKKLYHAVKKSVANHLMPDVKAEFGFSGERLVSFLESYFVASGWGLIKNVDLDLKEKKAIVRVSNNPFSRRLHGKAKMPADHVIRGILAGVFSRVFGESVDCVETHCSALGEADCEFIIKKQHEFDFSDKRVQKQLPLEL